MSENLAGVSTGSRMSDSDNSNADHAETLKIHDGRHEKQRADRVLEIINENTHIGQVHASLPTSERPNRICAKPSSLPTQDQLTLAEIDAQLRRSGTLAENVQCEVEASSVILSGRVRRYHHLQVVLLIAMHCRAGLRIVNKIDVDGIANS